jgi:hypothetical protein
MNMSLILLFILAFEISTKFRSPATAIRRGWNHLMPELTTNQIQLVVKTKKKYINQTPLAYLINEVIVVIIQIYT